MLSEYTSVVVEIVVTASVFVDALIKDAVVAIECVIVGAFEGVIDMESDMIAVELSWFSGKMVGTVAFVDENKLLGEEDEEDEEEEEVREGREGDAVDVELRRKVSSVVSVVVTVSSFRRLLPTADSVVLTSISVVISASVVATVSVNEA